MAVPGQVQVVWAIPELKFLLLACLKFPLRDNIPKNSFWGVAEGAGPSSVSAFVVAI
jgi:hypothetical protein